MDGGGVYSDETAPTRIARLNNADSESVPVSGECVLQRAVLVRKKLSPKEGGGWLSGTLFCTHFRVAFVPQDSPRPDVSRFSTLPLHHVAKCRAVTSVHYVGHG